MNKLLLLCLLLSCFHSGFAQVLEVRSQETGHPLQGVIISGGNAEPVVTDEAGKADISHLRTANSISIRLLGYLEEQKSFFELEQANFLVLLIPSGVSLDQVVLSASRWRQSRKEVPAYITRISRADVAFQNPQTAADMLALSGEVYIQKSQLGGGSPMIRGFSTNRLLMSIDGVRMNTAIFRSGNLQNVISLDPFTLENTEVFFGPGSVIYGSDAIGGVMSFQTLRPEFSSTDHTITKGSAAVRFASANQEFTSHFDVGLGGKKWAALSSLSYSEFRDLRMGSNGPDEYLRTSYVARQNGQDITVTNPDPLVQTPTGYHQFNLMQKLSFKPNQYWTLNYGLHYSTTSSYSRYDRLIRYRNGNLRSAEWSYGPQLWLMNHLNISYAKPNVLMDGASLNLAFQQFEESRIDRDFNDPERRTRLEKVNAWSANLDFYKYSGRHKFFYGLEAVLNDVNSTGKDEDITTNSTQPGAPRYPQAQWKSYAAYLSYQYQLRPDLLLQLAGRYTQFALDAHFDSSFYGLPFTEASLNNGALTGSLGIVFNPAQKTTVSANFSSGFRAPNVDDMGKIFDSEPGSVMVPNPALNAEYAYNLEAGFAQIFGTRLKVDATVFYTVLTDALVRRPHQLNGQDSIVYNGELSRIMAMKNAAIATVYGVQFGLDLKLPGGFGIYSRFNYQKGEEELDNGSKSPLRHAAPMYGVTHLTYKTSKLQLDLYGMYNGEVSFADLPQEEKEKDYMYAIDAGGNPYAPSWFTLNFKAGYQLNRSFTIIAGLENILDLRYRTYSSGIVAPGRNFIISARATF